MSSQISMNLFRSGKLHCAYCKQLLVMPIYLVENIGNICQKCYDQKSSEPSWLDGNKCLENTFVEDVLNELELPCKYHLEGCDAVVEYKELTEHESLCLYVPIKCFLFELEKCTWMGPQMAFTNHFKDQHNSHIISSIDYTFDVFTFQHFKTTNIVKMLECNENSYFFVCSITKNELQYFVCGTNIEESEEDISITFTCNGNLISKRGVLLPFKKAHNKENPIRVNIESMKHIFGGLEHVKNNLKILKKDWIGFVWCRGLQNMLEQILACTICYDLMKPPIKICKTGHNICSSCRDRVTTCPTCRQEYIGTRNLSLEDLTSKIKYPCNNEGCSAFVFHSAMSEHQLHCEFKSYPCPDPFCDNNTVNDFTIVDHLKTDHRNLLVQNKFKKSFKTRTYFTEVLFCLVSDKAFRIQMRFNESGFQCSVEICRLRELRESFNYELTVLRPQAFNLNWSHQCHKKLRDNSFEGCSTFKMDFLAKYSMGGEFSFICEIVKVANK